MFGAVSAFGAVTAFGAVSAFGAVLDQNYFYRVSTWKFSRPSNNFSLRSIIFEKLEIKIDRIY